MINANGHPKCAMGDLLQLEGGCKFTGANYNKYKTLQIFVHIIFIMMQYSGEQLEQG